MKAIDVRRKSNALWYTDNELRFRLAMCYADWCYSVLSNDQVRLCHVKALRVLNVELQIEHRVCQGLTKKKAAWFSEPIYDAMVSVHGERAANPGMEKQIEEWTAQIEEYKNRGPFTTMYQDIISPTGFEKALKVWIIIENKLNSLYERQNK